MSTSTTGPAFHEGDEVVLAEGTYQGTSGVFLRLREDPAWADITQRDGTIRSHPVAWLAHSTTALPRGTP
ncbi:MAG TPA: hypothetical protein VMR62_30105 [Bryobacteraceae bacterium]|nr:hypothetical protein [Bryobacteraceae bacterium]